VPGATLAADADPAVVQALAARLPAEDVQLYYQMALLGRRDLPLAPDPASGLEMLLLRLLVFRPAGGTDEATASAPRRAPVTQPAPKPGGSPAPARAPASAASALTTDAFTPAGDDWATIVPRLGLRGAAQQLAQHCVLRGRRGEQFDLAVDARSRSLLTPATRDALTGALSQLIGASARVEFGTEAEAADTPAQQAARADTARAAQAREALESDPTVRGLMQTLDARLVDGSARSD
jgi:DNA polymerase-3 subunit gamma/tau